MGFEELKNGRLLDRKIDGGKFDRIRKLIGDDEEIKAVFRNKDRGFAVITNKRVAMIGFEDKIGNLLFPGKREDRIIENLPLVNIDKSSIRHFKKYVRFTSVNGMVYTLVAPHGFTNFLKTLIEKRRSNAVEKGEMLRKLHPPLSYINGLPSFRGDYIVTVLLYPDKLVFKQEDKPSCKLPLKRISDIKVKTEEEVRQSEKDRSVIKRAVAGQVIAGPLGAIVGGMSGVQSKKEQEKMNYYFLVVDYTSKEGKEKKIMLSVSTGSQDGITENALYDFVSTVQEKTPGTTSQKDEVEL